MGKKSLGRGLKEISNTFLTSANAVSLNEVKEIPTGFTSEQQRDDICESCCYYVDDFTGDLKCRIFTFANKKYNVPHLEIINLYHACYCKYFEAVADNKPSPSSEDTTELRYDEDDCEVGETETVRKTVAYPNTPDAHKKIMKFLSKHIDQGYKIVRIELKKTDQITTPGRKIRKEEEVIVFVKEPPSF